jgi:hypothetical protein
VVVVALKEHLQGPGQIQDVEEEEEEEVVVVVVQAQQPSSSQTVQYLSWQPLKPFQEVEEGELNTSSC